MAADLNLLNGGDGTKKGLFPGWLNLAGACAFLLCTTLAAVSYECYMLYCLQDKRSAAQKELRAIREQRAELDANLAEVRQRLSAKEDILDFMLDDIRAAGILSELASCAEKDVVIDRVELTPGRAALFGRAENAGAISGFSGALRESGLFSAAVRQEAEQGDNSYLPFFFLCELRDTHGLNEADG